VKRKVHLALKYFLALGTLGYGIASMSQPERFSELTGRKEDDVRRTAMRDVGSGIAILTSSNPSGPLISRAVFDFRDAFKLIRTRRSAASLAIAWGVLAILVFLTRVAPAVDANS
jgi:hypothetical protein